MKRILLFFAFSSSLAATASRPTPMHACGGLAIHAAQNAALQDYGVEGQWRSSSSGFYSFDHARLRINLRLDGHRTTSYDVDISFHERGQWFENCHVEHVAHVN